MFDKFLTSFKMYFLMIPVWLWIPVGGILFIVVLVITLRFYYTFFVSRDQKLRRWARGVQFSTPQLSAMRSLWHWYRTGQKALSDPLEGLDTTEMADLMNKCDPQFVAPRFRPKDDEARRRKLVNELSKIGMNVTQAQIVAAMKYCCFGPAKDSTEI